jgi:hypothetical protein
LVGVELLEVVGGGDEAPFGASGSTSQTQSRMS